MEQFAWEWDDPRPPREVLDRVVRDDLLLPFSDKGYVVDEGEGNVAYTRNYRPAWVWIVGILTFPLGLLLIVLLTKKATFTFTATPDDGGSVARAEGLANEPTRQIIETVYQEVGAEARPFAAWPASPH